MAPSRDDVWWSLPSNKYYKVNWDAANHNKWKRAGFGIIFGDRERNVFACLSTSPAFYSQPLVAECLALWRTIEFCTELGLQNVVLEGDMQVAINAVQQEEHD